MDLIYRDGRSYFIPAQTDNRINGLKQWEQAFRIYAAIYSAANPTRSAEIWQYVFVINTAPSTYVWDNVANYDYTFRHLMPQNPNRSWSRIYNQMWNLAMRDVIPKNSVFGTSWQGCHEGIGPTTNGVSNANHKGGSTPGVTGRGRKPKYCWAFNRGNCKNGPTCNFVHRCSYCDGDHDRKSCGKLSK